jgi:DNA-binding CsgD family transcriptional regulator
VMQVRSAEAQEGEADLCAADCAASLTEAERDVLASLASRRTEKETAHIRHMSLPAVQIKMRYIEMKLGTRSVAQSVAAVMTCRRENCEGRK